MDTASSLMRHLAIGMVQPWGDHDDAAEPQDESTTVVRSMYSINNHSVTDLADGSININNTEFNRPYYQHGVSGTDNLENDQMGDIPWWYTLMFVASFFMIVCLSMTLREICARYCGGDCAPTSYWPQGGSSRHSIRVRIGHDSSLMSDERREAKLKKQRQERRLWYQYYLKPYTVVLTAGDFVDDDDKLAEGNPMEQEEVPDLEMGAGTKDTEAGLDEEGDEAMVTVDLGSDDDNDKEHSEKDQVSFKNTTPTGLIMAPQEDNRMMRLWDRHDNTFRTFEANCTICYEDYEVGDVLVHSATDEDEEYCRHVFHRECMLAWLEKGKKRCPICRHWFVPAVRIHDQMKDANVETNPDSLRHLYDSRTMQGIATLNSGSEDDDTSSNMSYSGDQEDDVSPNADNHRGDPLRGDANMNHHHHHHRHTNPNAINTNAYYSPAMRSYMGQYRPAPSLADLARNAQLTLYGPEATPPTFPAGRQQHQPHHQATASWDPASHAMGTPPLPTPVPSTRQHSEGVLATPTAARDPASHAMALPHDNLADDQARRHSVSSSTTSSHHRRRHSYPSELLEYQAEIRGWAMPDGTLRV